MKKLVVFLCVVTLVFSMVGMAHATLIKQTKGLDTVIYDDVNEKYWIWDLSMFTSMTYSEQVQGIEDLDYFGSTEWHLADMQLILDLLNEFIALGKIVPDVFAPSHPDYLSRPFYWGRYDRQFSTWQAHYFFGGIIKSNGDWSWYALNGTYTVDNYIHHALGAWAVTDAADVSSPVPEPVPEPTTLMLLGVGLMGLITLRQKNTH